MTLIVEGVDSRMLEREYILSILLGEFLGVSWRYECSERCDVRIALAGEAGEIRLPDVLFSVPESEWLTESSMPSRPLPQWDTRDFSEEITLIKCMVPVIYGHQEPTAHKDNDVIALPVDILGSSFFMLSRYEELVTADLDEHDRFPAWASLAYQEGFLERPIVDEYVEILRAAMKILWPRLKFRTHMPRTRISHDVDRPSRYSFGSFRRFLRSVGGDIVRYRDFGAPLRGLVVRYCSPKALHPADRFNTFDWLMDVSEANDLQSAFFFIPGKTFPPHDPLYDLEDNRIRRLIRHIGERGHEVGVHPGYNTYRAPDTLVAQAERLRAVSEQEGVRQSEWGGRMHYLQWDAEVTPSAWQMAGMTYDSTLGYADQTGFRCGTSHDFFLYSWSSRKALAVTERPLIAMDGTLYAEKYMGLTEPREVLYNLNSLRSRCHLFGGGFNMLWHNSELVDDAKSEIYKWFFSSQ